MEIIRFVNSVFESNTYLVKDEQSNQCYLVDCGDSQPILEELQRYNLELTAVFITHSHFDHIYGLNEITSFIPTIKVYISYHGREGLYSDQLNLSKYQSSPFTCKNKDNIEVIRDGQQIPLFGRNEMQIKVYYTPGHDWSSCCYQMDNHLFSGDSFIPGLQVVTSFPNSNRIDAESSQQRIIALAEGRNFYPGHGNVYENFLLEKYI